MQNALQKDQIKPIELEVLKMEEYVREIKKEMRCTLHFSFCSPRGFFFLRILNPFRFEEAGGTDACHEWLAMIFPLILMHCLT
jgi:hypothetical protein